jgi:ABC-type multidrug transport system ATPase subunit
MSSAYTIKTENLSYHFTQNIKTLDNVNLSVEKGSIYGFLGPNGAGKTTTLRLLIGLLKIQKGSIRIFDEDSFHKRIDILKKVGSLIEQPSIYGHLSAKENIEVNRKIYNVSKSRINAVLELVELADTGNKKARAFSLGMKQRLSIAIALVHQPELLILDEPTNGLDPNGIIETRELIKRLNREEGVTIIVSSHILAEVEKMATHVGIIHKGRLLFQGSLSELQHLKNKQRYFQIDTSDNDLAAHLLQCYEVRATNGYLAIPCLKKEDIGFVSRKLIEGGVDLFLLQPQQNDLEQLFLDITSGSI